MYAERGNIYAKVGGSHPPPVPTCIPPDDHASGAIPLSLSQYTPTPAITVYTPPECVPYSEPHTRLCKHTAFGCIPAYTQATSIYTTLPVCVPLELYPYSHPRTRLLRKSLN